MGNEDEPRVTLRRLTKVVTKFRSLGGEIKSIRKKGLSALTNKDDATIFLGMHSCLDKLYEEFVEKYEEASDYCEVAEGAEAAKPPSFPRSADTTLFNEVKIAFYEAKGYYAEISDRRVEATQQRLSVLNTSGGASVPTRAILPKILIKKYDGNDLSQWGIFKQMFSSLIMCEDNNLSDGERFHYLVSYLEGPAYDLIKHIPMLDLNFRQAWKILIDTYDDQRKIASSYLENFLSYKPIPGKPTYESLQKYLSTVTESIVSLKNLDIPDFPNYLLCEIALRGLDPITREAFETKIIGTKFPVFETLQEFVRGRCQVLQITHGTISSQESTQLSRPIQQRKSNPRHPNSFLPPSKPQSHSALLTQTMEESTSKPKSKSPEDKQLTCPVCRAGHRIAECQQFLSATPAERLNMLKTWMGCRNCLYPFHRTAECKSERVCRYCKKKHHSSLHLPTNEPSPSSNLTKQSATSSDVSPNFSGASTSHQPSVLLGTVNAYIKDSKGELQRFRGVLDVGSQHTFLTEDCVQKLGRSTRPFNASITGVNGSPLNRILGKVDIRFEIRQSSPVLKTEAVVVPTITPPLPQTILESQMWPDYRSYPLSDPDFCTPGEISFLIGADLYPDVVTGKPIILFEQGPRLISTVFGLSVIGRLTPEEGPSSNISLLSLADMAPLINRFWEIEEVKSTHSHLTPEEEKCEQHFRATHRRDESGRYIVSLPFKTPKPQLQLSVEKVIGRLRSLESKLSKNDALSIEYHEFMDEYLSLGHMSPATQPPAYLIPHHAVHKTDASGKTKIRVVFDASFRTATGALNSHLMTGMKLQADIRDIVLHFRRFSYVLTCDIVKCFRQIRVEEADKPYQQIAWRTSPDQPIQYFQLDTVTYGLSCSPYLSNRVLRQLAEDEGSEFPLAAHALKYHSYVDDIAYGADSTQELEELKEQLVNLLARGGFQLDKWSSNYPPLLEAPSQQSVELDSDDTLCTKVLGMHWNPSTDSFFYKVAFPDQGFTKRKVLSIIARLYDPLGYLAPAIFYAKRILQETWKAQIGWDEELTGNLRAAWHQFTTELPQLSAIRIARPFPKSDTQYQLLGYSDASEKGYCAVVYLRATNGDQATSTILMAKTRLAPLKTLTIPRLELCGALLLTELIKSLSHLIQELGITEIYNFTDSSVVLSWLKTPTYLLQTWVAARVQKILDATDLLQWFHINGTENPADVGSRGIMPSLLQQHTLWWNGPSWSLKPISEWPISADIKDVTVPEMKPVTLSLVSVSQNTEFIRYSERHSSYLRLVRVVAYIRRFVANCRISKAQKASRSDGPLSSQEVLRANHHCIQLIQHHYYPEAFRTVDFNSLPLELRRLRAFVDTGGVLRVGGRLQNAPLSEDEKHPILLPSRSHFTKLIIDFFHRKNHHIGPNALLAIIRREYWIPSSRNLVRLMKHKCVVCIRYSRQTISPLMGSLPVARFHAVRPFVHTGVDFAGPFLCRESHLRKSSVLKAYLCIFVCLSSRAVHLELALGLSVENFLDSFDRFIARRGIPSKMYSDQGTNFVGAVGYLKHIAEWFNQKDTQEAIVNHTSHLAVGWKFNPPLSPHFGGGWESAVKSSKNLLYKTFGGHPFTTWELSTMFTKVEGLLNSRPLQPVSDSPDDLEALTPGHFIIGQPLTALPEPNFTEVPDNRLNKWEIIRERVQFFWSRWKEEYVRSLQPCEKWNKDIPNLKSGDLVLIRDTNTPPSTWPMARVLEIHPGKDDVVRVVTLRTSKGVYKRPVVKLVPLVM